MAAIAAGPVAAVGAVGAGKQFRKSSLITSAKLTSARATENTRIQWALCEGAKVVRELCAIANVQRDHVR